MKIFISYSHYDREIAQILHRNFAERGFDVSWDGNITFGSRLDELQKMILDCDVFLVIVSGNSIESNYVQSEISLALGYMGTRNKPIIPYILERVEKYIPSNLLQYQCFMGTEDIESDAIELANAIEKIKGSILAKQEETQKALNTAREVATEKVEVVKRNLAEYTDEVFERLKKNEKRDRRMAFAFYCLSVLFLIVTALISIKRIMPITSNADALKSVEYIISNILALTIIIALSRLSFTLGKAFMTSALRSEDRIHAISFGKFFIQAYGDEATRDEVRAVFGEWNIDKGTSFHSQSSSDFDPNIMNAFEIIKDALTKKSQ